MSLEDRHALFREQVPSTAVAVESPGQEGGVVT